MVLRFHSFGIITAIKVNTDPPKNKMHNLIYDNRAIYDLPIKKIIDLLTCLHFQFLQVL